MKNIELRKEVLQNGTFKQYCKDRKELMANGKLQEASILIDDDSGEVIKKNTVNGEYFNLSQEEAEECEKARHCRDMQRRKVQDLLAYIIREEDLEPVFLTYTLDDDALLKSHEAQKKAITRSLEIAGEWALNEDYGKTTGRKHFHAVAGLKKGTYTLIEERDEKGHLHYHIPELEENYHNGYVGIEPIRAGNDAEIEESIARVSRYEAKLSLHSVKVKQTYVSTKRGTPYQEFKRHKKKITHVRGTDARHDKAQTERVEKWWQDKCQEAKEWQESEECPF